MNNDNYNNPGEYKSNDDEYKDDHYDETLVLSSEMISKITPTIIRSDVTNDMESDDNIDLQNISNEIDNIIIENSLYDDSEDEIKIDEMFTENIKFVYDFCCMCGNSLFEHNQERHRYFPAKDEYKCKKCGLFFFEHTHNSQGCYFTPFKHLSG